MAAINWKKRSMLNFGFPKDQAKMKHIRGFDGLRAFAVLGVMFVHLGWKPFEYGWVGVPFFFVLSGFLITEILLDNKESNARTFFSVFYVRRALRIFPLYFLYLAVIGAWCALLGVKTEGWPWFFIYLQNYYLGARDLRLTPGMDLSHTWSLAVEEQFYMLWPLVIFATSRQLLKALCVLLIVGGVVSRYWIANNLQYVAFAPLSSNLDTLCLGALLAILARDSDTKFANFSRVTLVIGIALLIAINVWPPGTLNASNSIFMFVLAIVFAGVVGTVACSTNGFGLEWKPLAYIGRISYGLYIWHAFGYGIVSVAVYHKWVPDLGWMVNDIARIAITFGIATVSFHYFERPILRLKDRVSYGAARPGRSPGNAATS
jgi:peptidoglycan/LPS O-acetylase OafA/YrhL